MSSRELRITEEDIERHLPTNMSGGGFGHTRTVKELEKDFKVIHVLRVKGYNFHDITQYLNSINPYVTTERANAKMYFNKLDTIELMKNNEEEAQLHKRMMVENLDFVIREALAAWRVAMEGGDELIERSGYIKTLKDIAAELESGQMMEEDELRQDFKESLSEMQVANLTHPISKRLKKEFVRITTDKGRADKARFLEIIIKAETQKAKLLGLVQEKAQNVDIVNVLNQIVINDSSPNEHVSPITNEADAATMFDDATELMIEDRYKEAEVFEEE